MLISFAPFSYSPHLIYFCKINPIYHSFKSNIPQQPIPDNFVWRWFLKQTCESGEETELTAVKLRVSKFWSKINNKFKRKDALENPLLLSHRFFFELPSL